MKHSLLWLHGLTPLHNGAGQGLGIVDRPIIREAGTNYPFLQSSTLKGAFRARVTEILARTTYRAADDARKSAEEDGDLKAAFGKGETEGGNQGCVIFSDAQLVLFPVRSLVKTLAWVTSRLALGRLFRWLQIAGDVGVDADGKALSGLECIDAVVAKPLPNNRGEAVGGPGLAIEPKGHVCCVEGIRLDAAAFSETAPAFSALADWLGRVLFADGFWRSYFCQRLMLLADDDFNDLMVRATQVEANIQVLPSGVTKGGSLRYTEYLPAETVMLSLMSILDPLVDGTREERAQQLARVEKNLELACSEASATIQIGADESKGKGILRIVHKKCAPAAQEGGESEGGHAES